MVNLTFEKLLKNKQSRHNTYGPSDFRWFYVQVIQYYSLSFRKKEYLSVTKNVLIVLFFDNMLISAKFFTKILSQLKKELPQCDSSF